MTDLPPEHESAQATPWWLWPHVLSLEAPLVAVLWQRALAHAHGIRLTPLLDAGLALACWVIYVLDRTLDTFASNSAGELDLRHAFYHRHRRVLLLGVLPPALMTLAWMALNVIPAFFTSALLPIMSRQAQNDKEALKRTYTLWRVFTSRL